LDFVSQYVELDPQGRAYCPFHDDQNKSFQVSANGNYWNCHAGCGGGSVIDFWMFWRKKHGKDDSFKATITDLATMLLD
jgi:DNA primase